MPGSVRQEIDPDTFVSLDEASRRYRLDDSSISNLRLARLLELDHDFGDHCGFPNCCFYTDGRLVAIRTKRDEIVVFHVWQMYQRRLESLAKRIA